MLLLDPFSLTEIQQILDRLRSAFDPLGVVSSPSSATPKLAEAASVLGMADLVKTMLTLVAFGTYLVKKA